MGREPYRSARRVFLIADNGSCHRGRRAADRLRTRWPSIVLVHTPVHASWLNQIEVYFSVVQRKLLTPNDFESLVDLKRNVMAFQTRYQRAANHSSGPSRAVTCTRSLPSSRSDAPKPEDYGSAIRHRNCESGY